MVLATRGNSGDNGVERWGQAYLLPVWPAREKIRSSHQRRACMHHCHWAVFYNYVLAKARMHRSVGVISTGAGLTRYLQ